MNEHLQWCIDCGQRFTEEEVEGATACPSCGSKGVPCDAKQDVTVEINWRELRCLGIWADNWCGDRAKDQRKSVQAILRRLEKQYPDYAPLTLGGEFRQIREAIATGELQAKSVEQVSGTPMVELPIQTYGPGAVGYGRKEK